MRNRNLFVFLATVAVVYAVDQNRAAWISSMPQGGVSFHAAGAEGDEWGVAEINRKLVDGDMVATIPGATADIQVDSDSLHLGEDTTVGIGRMEGRTRVIDLKRGALDVDALSITSGDIFEVDTKRASLSLDRAGRFRVELDGEGNPLRVAVTNGACQMVMDSGQIYTVSAGQRATFSGTQVSIFGAPAAPAAPQFPPQAVNPPTDPRFQTPGSNLLSNYGAWQQTPYGLGWYPSVSAGWAPYTNGQWDYIEPDGWTWVAAEPWGFAPYHYGRWSNSTGAWFWIPDMTPTYSPALVGWISAGPGYAGTVGWFPLGPHEPYIAAGAYYPAGTIRYANLGFATVVPRQIFAGARPVLYSRIAVSRSALLRASVTNYAAIAPTRASVVGSRRAIVYPSAAVVNSTVVARTPHASPALSLTQRQQLWANAPGRPLTGQQLHPAYYQRQDVRMLGRSTADPRRANATQPLPYPQAGRRPATPAGPYRPIPHQPNRPAPPRQASAPPQASAPRQGPAPRAAPPSHSRK